MKSKLPKWFKPLIPYETEKWVVEDLDEAKLKHRLELCEKLPRRGTILELYAGKGLLSSQAYAKYADHLILVDKEASYLEEAHRKLEDLRVAHTIYCKDNIKFIKEDLARIEPNIVLADFDAFGSPARQVKAFFNHYKVKAELTIAITDGLGLKLSFIHRHQDLFKKYRGWYVLAYWSRRNIEAYNDGLIKQIAERYRLGVEKVNVAYGCRRIPCFLGYRITPPRHCSSPSAPHHSLLGSPG